MDIKEVAKKYTREEFLKSDIIMDWCPSDYRLKKDCAKHMSCFCCEGIKKSMEHNCPKCWENAVKNIKFRGEDTMKKFTKSDLKDEMVVEYRNGDLRMKLGNQLLSIRNYMDIESYDENLLNIIGIEAIDIIKIYKCNKCRGLKEYFEKENLELIWERKEQQPVTFQEVLNSDKKCKVEHELIKKYAIKELNEFKKFDTYLYKLSNSIRLSNEEVKEVIKNGKWYLED